MLKRELLHTPIQNSFSNEVDALYKTLTESQIKNIIGLSVFIDASSMKDFQQKKKAVKEQFSKIHNNLPVNVISQPSKGHLTMEAWTNSDCKTKEFRKNGHINYCLYNDSLGTSLFILDITTEKQNPAFEHQVIESFDLMSRTITNEGFNMDDVIRQWNYIPAILNSREEKEHTFQNYQIFNDIRKKYYDAYKKDKNYPAATGIGVEQGNVTIDCLAVKRYHNIELCEIDNPNQIEAYKYGQEVLVGSSINIAEKKKSPLFSRAKFIGNQQRGLAFISGTASILGEKTIGESNIVKQMQTTFSNISELVQNENIKHFDEIKYNFLRVYVKKGVDLQTVVNECQSYYKDSPISFVQADVCRDNLLIEIEAEVGYSVN